MGLVRGRVRGVEKERGKRGDELAWGSRRRRKEAQWDENASVSKTKCGSQQPNTLTAFRPPLVRLSAWQARRQRGRLPSKRLGGGAASLPGLLDGKAQRWTLPQERQLSLGHRQRA